MSGRGWVLKSHTPPLPCMPILAVLEGDVMCINASIEPPCKLFFFYINFVVEVLDRSMGPYRLQIAILWEGGGVIMHVCQSVPVDYECASALKLYAYKHYYRPPDRSPYIVHNIFICLLRIINFLCLLTN